MATTLGRELSDGAVHLYTGLSRSPTPRLPTVVSTAFFGPQDAWTQILNAVDEKRVSSADLMAAMATNANGEMNADELRTGETRATTR